MGGGGSRCIVTPEEARRRLGYERAGQVERSWRRLSSRKGLGQDAFKEEFLHSVLPCMPGMVSSALFAAFDSRSTGLLSLEDLLSCLCVLYKGSPEERLKLIFCILDTDRDDRVTHRDILDFISECEADDFESIKSSLAQLRSTDRLNAVAFSRWYEHNPELISWIRQFESSSLSPHHKSLVSRKAEEDERLLATTLGIENDFFENLAKAHDDLKAKSRLGVVCQNTIAQLPTSSLTKAVFTNLDQDGTGTVSLRDLVSAVATCQTGTKEEKLRFCHDMFVHGEEPVLTKAQATDLLKGIFDVPGVYTLASIPTYEHAQLPDEVAAHLGDLSDEISSDEWVRWGAERIPAPQIDLFVTSVWQLASIDLHVQPESRTKEVEILKKLNSVPDSKGVRWYLVSKPWWDKVMDPEGTDVPTTPSIVSQCLLDTCALNLRANISKGEDYEVMSQGAWKAVKGWYGLGQGTARETIEKGSGLELELYPVTVRVALGSPDMMEQAEQLSEFQVSRVQTSEDIIKLMCKKVGETPVDNARLYEKDGTEVPLSEPLESMDIADGHFFLLHIPPEPNCKTPDLAPRYDSSSFCSSFAYDSPDKPPALVYGSKVESYYITAQGNKSQHVIKGIVRAFTPDEVRVAVLSKGTVVTTNRDWVTRVLPPNQTWDGCNGKVGLQNLGNTCYMNSVLQVLSHTRAIRDYFVHYCDYAYDLNTSSPWGMGGKLTIAFAELMESLWCTTETTAPRRFRGLFGQFKPDYAQYLQQDAEEFLSELLVGLSAELSEECKDEYVEYKDANDRPDEEVAAERWDDLMKREHSFITKLFFSQFKSKLTCTQCDLVTRNFPYISIIPLPLPEFPHQYYEAILHTTGLPSRVSLKGSEGCCLSDLIDECVEVGGGCAAEYVAALLTDNMTCLSRMLPMQTKLSALMGQQVHIYRVRGHKEGNTLVPLVHRKYVTIGQGESFEQRVRPVLYGYLMLVSVQDAVGYDAMREQVWDLCMWMMPDYKKEKEYPFILTTVRMDGNGCSGCSWVRGCFGCLLEETPVAKAVAIDWNSSLLHRYDNSKLCDHVNIVMHPSVQQHREEVAAGMTCDLESCLENYTKTEMPKICGRCSKVKGEAVEAVHKEEAEIYRLPPVLIVQLKKFAHDSVMGQTKINGLVNFPVKDLQVGKWCAQGSPHIADHRYDLYAVVNHRGASGHGHYYSYVQSGGGWHCFNDSVVTPIAEADLVTPEAYLLFYKCQSPAPRRLRSLWPEPAGKRAGDHKDIRKIKNEPWERPTTGTQKKNRNCTVM